VLRTSDLNYELPAGLIATRPAEPRDSARLMVVGRGVSTGHGVPRYPEVETAGHGVSRYPGGLRVEHRIVRELPEILQVGDLLVFNITRVIPARFRGRRVGTGGKIEGLYLHEREGEDERQGTSTDVRLGAESRATQALETESRYTPAPHWVALIKGRHTRAGAVLELHDRAGRASGIRLEVVGRPREEPEAWVVRVGSDEGITTREVLERVGLPPLPPYIVKARKDRGQGEQGEDAAWYQTVYAQEGTEHKGSVAAPTAGLHFTPELLRQLEERGIDRSEVVLHVGAGTFRPVETEFVEQHPMHAEWCSMSAEAIRHVQEVRQRGGRVIPVGTTALRTLESYAAVLERSQAPPQWLSTRLLITPGYRFHWCDGMMTNFHLPRSTLMALVGAMLEDAEVRREEAGEARGAAGEPGTGIARLKDLYREAATEGYRFYSFGDAMLIL
jgi:S-adenosylmethionine:tRNA ribosyltransferase-isomerase